MTQQDGPPGWTPQGPPGWTPQSGGQAGWNPPAGPPTWGWSPPPPSRGRRLPIVIGVIVVAVVIIAIVGALTYLGSSFGNSSFGNQTALNDLTVGQCFNGGRVPAATSAQILFAVDVVDCSDPHTSELAATFDYPSEPAAPYPGLTIVHDYAEQQCIDRFLDYVGLSFNDSALDMTFIYPQDANWSADDRSIQCVIHPPSGTETSTGSFRNARR